MCLAASEMAGMSLSVVGEKFFGLADTKYRLFSITILSQKNTDRIIFLIGVSLFKNLVSSKYHFFISHISDTCELH